MNKYLMENIEAANCVTAHLMTVMTEYADEVNDLNCDYEINDSWALLFRGDKMFIEQYTEETDTDDRELLSVDVTEYWIEEGEITPLLIEYIEGTKTIVKETT